MSSTLCARNSYVGSSDMYCAFLQGQVAELEGSIAHTQADIDKARERQLQLQGQHAELTQCCSNSLAALNAILSVSKLLPSESHISNAGAVDPQHAPSHATCPPVFKQLCTTDANLTASHPTCWVCDWRTAHRHCHCSVSAPHHVCCLLVPCLHLLSTCEWEGCIAFPDIKLWRLNTEILTNFQQQWYIGVGVTQL
jgi:hypothetical protein